MTNKTTLALLVSLSSACGLINVNGKPLGGGSSSRSSTTNSSSGAGPAETEETPRGETIAQYEARQKRMYEEQDRKAAAEKAGELPFCRDNGVSAARTIKLDWLGESLKDDGNWTRHVNGLAEAMCAKPDVPDRAKAMAIRDKWMKMHGLDEDDFLVVYVQSHGRSWPSQGYAELGGPVPRDARPTREDMDRLGSHTSALARFTFVDWCLQEVREKSLLQSILCTTEPLDAAKAYAEIEALETANPGTRYQLRQTVFETGAAQAKARAEVATQSKEDPGVAKLVAIAEAQRKDWATANANRTKLVTLLETMEAATMANKRSGFAGCEAKTYAAWAEVAKAAELPAVEQEEVLGRTIGAMFKTPESYLAYRAFELCAKGVEASFSPGYDLMGDILMRRGPRTSIVAAWVAAVGDIKFDSKALSMSQLLRDLKLQWTVPGLPRVSAGVINKLATKDGWVTVSFKPDIIEREDCVAWKQTNQISKIESDGSVRYWQVCTKHGMVKVDRTPDDATISALVAEGLKPGMYFMVVSADRFPIVATASAKSTKAIWALGVAK